MSTIECITFLVGMIAFLVFAYKIEELNRKK